MVTYTYTNKSVQPNIDGISFDVANSAMTNKNYQGSMWDQTSQNLYVYWDVDLSSGDKTILDTIVANNSTARYIRQGWNVDEVSSASYYRPLDLLIYYGWLNSFNNAINGYNNEKVAQDLSRYSMLVFGDGLQDPSHGDYANTIVIIPRIKALNPQAKIFGYVSCNQTYANFQTKVDQWNTLQVHGIFIDSAGYDYGTVATNGREAYNQKADYVHDKVYANLVFTNAWNMDHIIGIVDDPTYPNSTWNPSLIASKLSANDWYLLESFPVNTSAFSGTGGYESRTEWYNRGVKAVNHRRNFGINLAANIVIGDSNANAITLFNFGFVSAAMFSLEAFGSSDENYGASSAKTTYRTRPDTEGCGRIYVYQDVPKILNDTTDSDVYVRFVQYAKFLLDFSSAAQLSSINKTKTERVQVLQLLSDQNTSSQTLGDCTGLNTFHLEGKSTYYFRFNCIVQTNAGTVGILLSVNASAAISSINFLSKWPTGSSAWSFGQFTALQGGTLPTTGPGTTNVDYILEGTIITNTPVIFALQFRSETATQTTIKAGSIGRVERIA